MTSQPVDWALTRDDLSAPKHLLLVTIAWLADGDGVTFKSQKTIAARLAKDPRWVREHLPELARLGLLTRRRRHRLDGSRTTDLIVLNLPRTAPLDLSAYSGIVGAPEPGDVEPSGENPPGLAANVCQPSGGNPPTVINLSENLPAPTEQKASAASDVDAVFARWVAATGRQAGRTKLTADRRRRIVKALKEYDLDDCLQAVENIGRDEWAMGDNKCGRPFNDIQHALGGGERIEKWRDWKPPMAQIAQKPSRLDFNRAQMARFAARKKNTTAPLLELTA